MPSAWSALSLLPVRKGWDGARKRQLVQIISKSHRALQFLVRQRKMPPRLRRGVLRVRVCEKRLSCATQSGPPWSVTPMVHSAPLPPPSQSGIAPSLFAPSALPQEHRLYPFPADDHPSASPSPAQLDTPRGHRTQRADFLARLETTGQTIAREDARARAHTHRPTQPTRGEVPTPILAKRKPLPKGGLRRGGRRLPPLAAFSPVQLVSRLAARGDALPFLPLFGHVCGDVARTCLAPCPRSFSLIPTPPPACSVTSSPTPER